MTRHEEFPIGNVFAASCPSRLFLSRISNKWALLTVDVLGDGALRATELRNRMEGISKKVMGDVLGDLQELGLVERTEYRKFPPHVEYGLTPKGYSLREVVAQLDRWVERNYG